MLREEAYRGVDLETQLEEQARRFLSDRSRNRTRNGRLEVSKIFDWFKEDFEPRDQYFLKYAGILGLPPGASRAARFPRLRLVAERLSVVVPALNEAGGIRAALEALAPLRARGHEVIVVDGGSSDGTVALADGLCDLVLTAPRGRAVQMNAGARAASGDVLLFLHADTRLPPRSGRLWS